MIIKKLSEEKLKELKNINYQIEKLNIKYQDKSFKENQLFNNLKILKYLLIILLTLISIYTINIYKKVDDIKHIKENKLNINKEIKSENITKSSKKNVSFNDIFK